MGVLVQKENVVFTALVSEIQGISCSGKGKTASEIFIAYMKVVLRIVAEVLAVNDGICRKDRAGLVEDNIKI